MASAVGQVSNLPDVGRWNAWEVRRYSWLETGPTEEYNDFTFLGGDMRKLLFLLTAAAVMNDLPTADGQSTYRKPPGVVTGILDAPSPPAISVNPSRTAMALIESEKYPSIADLAEPMTRLAGIRLNANTFGPARPPRVTGITIMSLVDPERLKNTSLDRPRVLKLPPGKVSSPDWSPDGNLFALTATSGNAISLYTLTPQLELKPVEGIALNGVLGDPIRWLAGSDRLLVKTVPPNRPPAPKPPAAPIGPTVQQTSGPSGPVRTYQDLLQNSHDEDLFEYLCTCQIVVVDVATGDVTPLGKPDTIAAADPSPDGNYILVTRIQRPYSYLYSVSSFPKVVEVWNRKGNVIHTVANLPLQDKVPIEGVPTGPRGVTWSPNKPATLVWVEARDDGDPKKKVPFRDELFEQAAPFTSAATSIGKTEHRFAGLSFFEDNRGLLRDYDRDRRWSRTMLVDLAKPEAERKTLFDHSAQDRYNDPGSPLYKTLPNGERVLRTSKGRLLLAGIGATPTGDRPFLDFYDPATGKSERILQCGEREFATVAAVLNDDATRLMIRRESLTEPPNYYLREDGKERKLTGNQDPAPFLRDVKKELVTTHRPDGVAITFTLYLPAGHKPGEKLPTVFWAYPREFNSADTAGQVSGSQYRFTTLSGYSHLFFLTQGYAVMDEVSMPIVGPPETANDTFVQQLQANAKAAIDKAVEMGSVDRARIGCGGHSYGAFMTANLLAHTDLFRAGIARSGAYNRTLTPFGFQNERRTYWEAPEIYATMSPFHNAKKINEPILMLHGAADDNAGTFPMQSERLYQAIRGNGGTARLVLLPHESHGYAARETIDHVLAEQIDWFDKYVKNAGPRK